MSRIDRIAEPWGERTPYRPGESWPGRVDTFLAPGVQESQVEHWARSASLLHSDGDAMDIAVSGGRMVGVRGRLGDRVNRGRLGPKDLYGWQANHSRDRLTAPLIRRDGRLVETDWDTAMDRIADHSRQLLHSHGPGSIGFYTTGQFFLEEYYTLAVLARAGIGTNHLDGNTRMCTATAGEALKESFGLEKTSEALGRRPEPALLLLRDLRELHLCAVGNNVYWEMLAQAAQALRDSELLALTKACRPQTVRQMKWTETLIKELSPQALTSV